MPCKVNSSPGVGPCAPRNRPQLNGAVERAQSSWRYEFYACYDLPARLDKLQALRRRLRHRFNHVRPHDALDGKTPAAHLQTLSAATPSHMS
jgi:transposase InsO family protein